MSSVNHLHAEVNIIIPCFILNNNLVIIIMYIYIISDLFFLIMNFLNASDLNQQIGFVYIVGVLKWPQCVLPKSLTSHENEG